MRSVSFLIIPLLPVILLISCGGGETSSPKGTISDAPGLIALLCAPETAKYELCVVTPDGTNTIDRVGLESLVVAFAWSPDGRHLVISTGERLHLTTLGEGSKILSESTLPAGLFQPPAWSPDGTRIAVGVGIEELAIVNADASASARFEVQISGGTRPTWSPDGMRLAFNCDQVLCTIDADGRNLRRLGGTTMHPFASPIWAPDGERILFANGHLDISWVRPDGSAGGNLMPAGVLSADELALSPDGRRIAFKGDALHVYVMNSDGTDLKRVSSGELVRGLQIPRYTNFAPSLSPDGEYVVFNCNDLDLTKHDNVCVVSATGAGLRHLPISGGFPTWSPSTWSPIPK